MDTDVKKNMSSQMLRVLSFCCRDVLSSLRKHYGFQQSPQKRHQMKPENLPDELGVEQVVTE